jgi:hypothetical protein
MGGLHFILSCCFTVACSQALEVKDPLHSFPLFSTPFLAILSANSFPKISEWDGVQTVEISHPVSRSVQTVLIACLAGSELYLLNRSASIAEVLHFCWKSILPLRGGIERVCVLCFRIVFHTIDWSVASSLFCQYVKQALCMALFHIAQICDAINPSLFS